MNRTGIGIATIAALALLVGTNATAGTPMTSTITYQGRLLNGDQAVTDTADFDFLLFDAEVAGTLVGMSKSWMIPVVDGLFTVDLDFGEGAFTGEPRWLQISFHLKSGGDWVTLTPRQAIRPAPYALYALNSAGGGGGYWQPSDANIYFDTGNVGIGDLPGGVHQLKVKAGENEYALYALAPSNAADHTLIGETDVPTGHGVHGLANNTSGINFGVSGKSASSNGFGVYGENTAHSGNAIAVFGRTSNAATGFAGYFQGRGYFSGNLGLGTTTPSTQLDVIGGIKADSFRLTTSPAAGYVLTCDSQGNGTWQPGGGGGSSLWQLNGYDIYYNAGRVGIGTGTPTSRLHVIDSDTFAITGECLGEDTFGSLGGESAGAEGYGPWIGVYGSTGGVTGSGVRGSANSPTGANHGVYGQTDSDAGHGVTGYANSDTGVTAGVAGTADSPDGYGVWGNNTSSSGYNRAIGVYGSTETANGVGVKGYAANGGRGVWGVLEGTSGRGVMGQANAVSGTVYGVEAYAQSPDGCALFAFNEAETGAACAIRAETYHSDAFAGYFAGRGYFSARVGIGIEDPTQMLEVAGTVKATGVQIGNSATTGYVLTANAQGVGTWQAPQGGGEPLWQEGAGGDIYYTNGQVGIGIAGPYYPLHVVSSDYNTGYFSNTNPTAAAYSVYASATGTGATAVYGTVSSTTGTTCGVYGRSYSPSGRGVCGYNTAGGTAVYGYTGTTTGWAGFFYGDAFVDGDMGIGTQSPQAKLDVSGTVRMDGFKLDSAATNGYVLTCDSSGNGTWQEPTGSGETFTLPYVGSASNSGPAFQITNTGTSISSCGIKAIMNNPSSHTDTAAGIFSADGSNAMSIWAYNDSGSETIRADHDGSLGVAIYGRSSGDGGGRFSTTKVDGYGVKGTASASSGTNTTGGWFESNSSNGKGVYALATGDNGTAVRAITEGGEGEAIHAESPWTAIYAKGYNAAKFYGDVRVYTYGTNTQVFRVDDATGVTSVDVLHITGGSDLAEPFDVSDTAEPGTVVEIDPDNPGKLRISQGEYNRRVAGVVSGANGVAVGMMLADLPGAANSTPIALSGRVWVQCDASEKAVEPGDLLTTAARPGHAMPVRDFDRAPGTVIGKAMSALPKGETGIVLVLVNLQ